MILQLFLSLLLLLLNYIYILLLNFMDNTYHHYNHSKIHSLPLTQLTTNDPFNKIFQIPLEFQYEPVEILSKELTKLNSKYNYRIIFLGPRWSHSLILNKKYAKQQESRLINNPYVYHHFLIQKYSFQFKKVAKSSTFMDSHYKNQYYKTTIYYRAFEGMNPTLLQEQAEYKFDASFESSNLDCVVKVKQNEYDLFLRIDSNTNGHIQWAEREYQIKCLQSNEIKDIILEKQNLKPYIFSKKKYEKYGQGWKQGGHNVIFQQKKLRYDFIYEKIKVRPLSRLSFEYEFQFENDQVFFAYSVPYTYSQLLKEIQQLQSDNQKSQNEQNIISISNNGSTLMGLPIPIIKITDPNSSLDNKKIVLATGRIHPGESNGSIIMSGFLKFLCSQEAEQIRKRVIFIIVPMVNPDGVVLGNSRTCAMGKDLNRQYYNDNEQLFPEITNIKLLVQNILKRKQIHMFLDFHGHSQKKNAFSYGPSYAISNLEYCKSKILPKLISSKTQMFRYYSCIFRISECKKSTARAVMFEQYSIPYTYTIETSIGFYYNSQNLETLQFNREKWIQLGKKIGQGCGDYFFYISQYQEAIIQRREIKVKQKQKSKIGEQKRKSVKKGNNIKDIVKQTQEILIPKQEKKYQKIQKFQKSGKIQKNQKIESQTFILNLLDQINNQNFEKKMNQEDKEQQSDSGDERDQLEPLRLAQLKKIIKQFKQAELKKIQTKHKQLHSKKLTKFKQKKTSKSINNEEAASTLKQQKKIQSQILKNQLIQIKKPHTSVQRSRKKNSQKFNHNFIIDQNYFSQNYRKQITPSSQATDSLVIKSNEPHDKRVFTAKKNKNAYVSLISKDQNLINQELEADDYRSNSNPRSALNNPTTHTHNFLTDIIFSNHKNQRISISKNNRKKNAFSRVDKNKSKFLLTPVNKPNNQSKNQEATGVEDVNTDTHKDIDQQYQLQRQKSPSPAIFREPNALKVNFTKLLYMINSQTVQDSKEANANFQSLNTKISFPTAFYRIKQQIKTKKNINIFREEEISQKFSVINNEYLHIKKYK